MKQEIVILSREDFDSFRRELLNEVKAIRVEAASAKFQYMRSRDVIDELGISSSQLQKMRVNGLIPYTRIGDTLFYPRTEIEQILIDNAQNVA